MSLPGRLVERLEVALLDAFPDDDALDALAKRVGMQAKIPSRAPLTTRIRKLVEGVDAEGRVLDLLDAALRLVPGNAALAETQRVILVETTAAPAAETTVGARATRDLAMPKPAYPDADVQARAERLREAEARKTTLRNAGLPTDEVDREVLQRRRELREGGQLHAGDDVGGRYLLIEKIGRGGFAVVWKAHDTVEKQAVAVKVLHSNLAGDPQRRERFFRGAKAMMNLAHPAVVRVLDPRGEDGGFCYFVMELMTGGNLREAVLEKRVAQASVLSLIVQVGEALAKAHAGRVIHRDVKPSNIVLDEHGNAKLTDFDLVGAHDTTGGTRTGALGTVVYAAPECLDKPQDATARADVYGLGMTAVFCLLGQELTLSTFRNPERTIARLDCSPRVREVLERAVAWEADQRFEDAAAMLGALGHALEPEPAASEDEWAETPDALEYSRAPATMLLDDLGTEDRDGAADRPQPEVRKAISSDKPIAALRFMTGKYEGGEFPLRKNRELIIGRSSDADVVLPEDIVSSFHAKVVSTDTWMYLEDIGSTNGTFLNGDKVAGRVLLHEGDRILVGTSIIKVIPAESVFAHQSEAEARRRLETSAQQREAIRGRLMSGEIEELPLPELLRFLSTSRKSGVLTVNTGASTGKIYLRKGALYFAVINDDFAVGPQKSFYRMLSWLTGTFDLEPSVELQVMEELREPTEALLTEGLRQVEELRSLANQLPAATLSLGVPTPLTGKLRELTPLELDTFQLVLDHGQTQKVLDSFPGTDLEAARHLIRLMKREFVVDPQEPARSVDLPEPAEIPESTRALVIERLQQLDEFRDLQKRLPALGSPLAVPTPLAAQLRALTLSELDTFQGVLDHGQVRMVLSGSPDSALDMARNLVRLMQSELVVVP